MNIVDLDTRKWGDRPHWRFDPTYLLGRDRHGAWLHVPVGTPFTGPRGEGRLEHAFVCLVPDDRWWVASFQSDSHPDMLIYVDVTTPSEWKTPGHVTVIDLDLDVVLGRDGSLFIDDEDEFEEHRVQLGYPDDIVETARATADWLIDAIAARREPFGSASARWMELLTETP